MSHVLMRRGGNMIEFSVDGGSLPPDIKNRFVTELRYTHLHQLRGADAYDPITGDYRPTRSEIKLLHRFDGQDRLVCSIGWQYRLQRYLAEMGHIVEVVDVDPPHPRPNRFNVDWDRIFRAGINLFDKQIEWLSVMETYDHCRIKAPPGAGKTFTLAAYVLSHPWARIHIITDGVDIVRRNHQNMTKYISNVGMVGAGKCRFGHHVTIISADSLHKIGDGFNDPNSPSAADIVIFDEVHKAGAISTLEQLAKYKRCRMFGVSANMEGRFDNAEFQLEGLFGEVGFVLTYQEAQALGMVCPIQVELLKVNKPAGVKNPIDDLSTKEAKERHGIHRNTFRNQAIADRVKQIPEDDQTLIIVDKLDQGFELLKLLPDFELCYAPNDNNKRSYDARVEKGEIDPRQVHYVTVRRREQMRQDFASGVLKKAIATKVWGTGVDFPGLQVLLRADGLDNQIEDTQVPGRATRNSEGKEFGLVIDVLDEWEDYFLRRSKARIRRYKTHGWTILGMEMKRPGVRAQRWRGIG